MTTHEKALEAAWEAWDEAQTDPGHVPLPIAIAAYLSALLPEDVAGLVERLRYAENVAINDSHAAQNELACIDDEHDQYDDDRAKLRSAVEETISLIQSKAARIAELEDIVSRAQLNLPDHYINWHSDARRAREQGGE